MDEYRVEFYLGDVLVAFIDGVMATSRHNALWAKLCRPAYYQSMVQAFAGGDNWVWSAHVVGPWEMP